MRWKFLFFLISSSFASLTKKVPNSPWIREAETRLDATFQVEIEDFEKLEHQHQLILSKTVTENAEDFLLFHNKEYISVYDTKHGRVHSVFATVSNFRDISLRTFDMIQDPRTPRMKSDGLQPLFLLELGDSETSSVRARSSTNFFRSETNAHNFFLTLAVPQMLRSTKSLNMAMIPVYRKNVATGMKYFFTLETGEKTGLYLDIRQNAQERPYTLKSFFDEFGSPLNFDSEFNFTESFSFSDYISKHQQILRKVLKPRSDLADPRSIFLCRNKIDQYSPWYPNEEWNRCGEAYPSKDENQCQCDDKCLKRKDCCPDYMTSCHDEPSFIDQECFTEEDHQCPDSTYEKTTLLISTDGFRKDYLTRSEYIPTINRLRECGSTAEFMEPSYPSKTFPNHYTLVTGLFPSQHGIVGNAWYDWEKDAQCSVFNINDGKHPCNVVEDGYYGGDPIWNMAERHNLISACCLWPGNENPINGEIATYHWDYAVWGEKPFGHRILQILKWLNLPAYSGSGPKEGFRPQFLTLYFDEPDKTGHSHGPYDETGALDSALKRVDIHLQQLMDGLKMYNLDKCVNIVLATDHGMEQGLCEDEIAMAPIIRNYDGTILDETYVQVKSTTTQIGNKRGTGQGSDFDIARTIDSIECTQEENNFRVFDKYNFPKRLHYDESTSIESILLLNDRFNKSTFNPRSSCNNEGYMGTHGWDSKYDGMKVPLTLYGPAFKKGVKLPSLQNVDIYKLLMETLQIPADSDKLMSEHFDRQISPVGQFYTVMKNPTNLPEDRAWNQAAMTHKTDESGHSVWYYCDKMEGCEPWYNEDFDKPFWWGSFESQLLPFFFESGIQWIQMGAAFDVTGGGVYRDPKEWTGRTDNKWCHRKVSETQVQWLPSHYYIVIKSKSNEIFSALIPWRLADTHRYTPCNVVNDDEVRQTYVADFNCQLNKLGLDWETSWKPWWEEQLELHSSRILEVERLTTFGINIGQDDPVVDVQERAKMTSFGDFERLFASEISETTTTTTTTTTSNAALLSVSLFAFGLVFV